GVERYEVLRMIAAAAEVAAVRARPGAHVQHPGARRNGGRLPANPAVALHQIEVVDRASQKPAFPCSHATLRSGRNRICSLRLRTPRGAHNRNTVRTPGK